jgi:hypothetical protein
VWKGFSFKNVGMKLDLKKTVLLFASIHLLIAWVAERKEKEETNKTNNKSSVVSGEQVVKAKTAAIVKYPGGIFGHP